MNGVSVGGLCFTGGLFALDNAQQPGFRLDTPSGWYYGTCSITVLSIIIIAASALGVLLITILTGVAVCLYLRRRAKRLAGAFDCGVWVCVAVNAYRGPYCSRLLTTAHRSGCLCRWIVLFERGKALMSFPIVLCCQC